MFANESSDEPIDEDFYTFLNVSKEASDEEIKSAYKSLSKHLHPDKHPDPDRKRDAEVMFNKVKKAFDVLIDPHLRAIYDTLGTKGLETDGWALVEKRKTPQEIREEYERLMSEKEERRLQQRTNPKGSISIGINATDLFDHYNDETQGLYWPQMEISSMSISQSIDCPLTSYENLTLSGSLSSHNGTGHGTVATSLRHVVSAKSWVEVELAAGQGPVITLKGFRTITKKLHANCQTLLHFSPVGVRPGFNFVLSRHLGKNLIGYLTWKAGIQSCMNTMIAWDTHRARVVASVQLGLPHSFMYASYLHKFDTNETKLKFTIKCGTFGGVVEYGCETRISQHSIIGASLSMGNPSGVSLKIRLNRVNQSYIFPILLSDEVMPNAVFYGTVAPLLTFYCIKVLIINPYNKSQLEKEKQKLRNVNSAKLLEKRKEAESVIALMRESFARVVNREREKSGLVIIRALYGSEQVVSDYSNNDNLVAIDLEAFEVTVPLQCLVHTDSTLSLSNASKSQLPGFYDPNLGEHKVLFIRYKYKDKTHETIVDDLESIALPSEVHLI